MSSHRFHEDRLEFYRCADGVDRRLHLWDAVEPRGILLAIHGGMAHGGDFCTPALFFKQHGWTTVAPDLRGHGGQYRVDIDCFDDFIDDLKLLLDWVRERFPGVPIVLMGHSVGGLIATRYGLKYAAPGDGVQGYVMSSPFWANAIPVPRILLAMSGVLARLVPRMKAPIDKFTELLTRDPEIKARHLRDDEDGIRAQEVTIRFANEQLRMHRFVQQSIQEWSHPLFVVVAGQDRLADSSLIQEYIGRIKPELVTVSLQPDNFHENLNETNREEIYGQILEWLTSVVPSPGR